MELVIQDGITKKEIPYIAQIVRVADEYDAITAKRQYETHIDISKTLKLLIKEAQPKEHIKLVALDHLNTDKKLGKINARILKILFKVVIDDIIYEIACIQEYMQYLETEIKRLDTANKYFNKMTNSKKDKDKNYFLQGLQYVLSNGETIDNFHEIQAEYISALNAKKDAVAKLYNEIKIIKKLKV